MIEEKTRGIIRGYLDNCKLMNVSTLHNGKPRMFICWFSVDNDFNFYFISPQDSIYVGDIEKDSSVALSIVNSEISEFGVGKNGLQGLMVEGNCERLRGVDLVEGYVNFLKKYPKVKEYIKMIGDSEIKMGNTKIYRIVPRVGVWFDQVNFKEDSVDLVFG